MTSPKTESLRGRLNFARFVLCLLALPATACLAQTRPSGRKLDFDRAAQDLGSVLTIMRQSSDAATVNQRVDALAERWPGVPVYAKPFLVQQALSGLTEIANRDGLQPVAFPANLRQRLDTCPGRSLFLLERLTGVSAPLRQPMDGKPGTEAIDVAALQAQVDTYLRGLCDAAASVPGRLTNEQLKARYHGTIKEPRDNCENDVADGSRLMEFIDDFQPLGKPLATFQELSGVRGTSKAIDGKLTLIDFSYAGPLHAVHLGLHVRKGIICEVLWTPY